jgi:hypothetical protein
VIVAHLNPANGPDVTLRWFAALFERAWLPVLSALAVCAVGLARCRRPGLLELYWGAALALALFTLRGRGSDHNYLIESAAVACALAPRAFDWLWHWSDQRRPAALVGTALLAAATLVWGWATWTYWDDRGGVQSGRMPVAEIAGATNVLSEEPTPVLLAGRPLAVSDPFHLSMLTSAGRFDPSELANRVKRREFDLVVLLGDVRATRFFKRQPLWPEEVRLAIKDTYFPTGRVGPYWLYSPQR